MLLARTPRFAPSLVVLGLLASACVVPPDHDAFDAFGGPQGDGEPEPEPALEDGSSSTGSDESSDSDPGEPASEGSETGQVPSCGNAIAERDEDCDDTDLAGTTCEDLGFDGGELACDASCSFDVTSCSFVPATPVLSLAFAPVKRFDFSWSPVEGVEHYQLLESPAPGEPYVQLGDDIHASFTVSIERPLHLRLGASYVLRACNALACSESAPVDVEGSLVDAIGYAKASSSGAGDAFGFAVALSADGRTLAVGAPGESSTATGIDGTQANDGAMGSGAVYVLVRDANGHWSQEAYVKATNCGTYDQFGRSVALSADGDTLAIGAPAEDGSSIGIAGDPFDEGAADSGAVYVLVRSPTGQWSQQSYVKATNPDAGDRFGESVALSADGTTLAVGAPHEDGGATGIAGNQLTDTAVESGAVYVLVRDGFGDWWHQAYVKASNTDADDRFGKSVALSADGDTLAVGAPLEDGSWPGVGGNDDMDVTSDAGAVYVLERDEVGGWSQSAYVKASNPGAGDRFGESVALSADGHTLAAGAPGEASSAALVGGDQMDEAMPAAGAVYVLVRDADTWSQQAYVKPSTPDADDWFGWSVALSADGSALAVGAYLEDGSATGIGSYTAADDEADWAGAVYVLVRDDAGAWTQRSYVKASNTDASDLFGHAVALSADGHTLAVGARSEDGDATGLAGDPHSNARPEAGAVYLY